MNWLFDCLMDLLIDWLIQYIRLAVATIMGGEQQFLSLVFFSLS